MTMEKNILFLIIFSSLLVGVTLFYSDIAGNYELSVENISSLSKASEVNNQLNATYRAVTNTTTPLSRIPYVGTITDSFFAFFSAAWNGILLIINIPNLLFSVITDTSRIMGYSGATIPSWFILMLLGIVLLGIVMFVLKFLRQGVIE